ncbi:MAG: hypothetical protein ACE5EY_15050, partial [Anaerolineae bacterium]
YCSKLACRAASKHASQHRWLRSEKGREYFSGADNIRRVREWRAGHPGYWRRDNAVNADALQDVLSLEPLAGQGVKSKLNRVALQDIVLSQPALLIGLIANLTGNALQDDIAQTSRRYIDLGRDILGIGPGNKPQGGFGDVKETHSVPGASAPGP